MITTVSWSYMYVYTNLDLKAFPNTAHTFLLKSQKQFSDKSLQQNLD